jgi:hypothetical protein
MGLGLACPAQAGAGSARDHRTGRIGRRLDNVHAAKMPLMPGLSLGYSFFCLFGLRARRARRYEPARTSFSFLNVLNLQAWGQRERGGVLLSARSPSSVVVCTFAVHRALFLLCVVENANDIAWIQGV